MSFYKSLIFRITSSYSFGYTSFIAFMCSSSTCIRPTKGTELADATVRFVTYEEASRFMHSVSCRCKTVKEALALA